jgi:hypothetical protein
MWYINFSKDGEAIRYVISYLMVSPSLLKFLHHIPDDFYIFTEISISHTWWFLHLYWSFYITYLMVSPSLLKFLYHIPDGFSTFTEVSISHTWCFLHLYWSFYISFLIVSPCLLMFFIETSVKMEKSSGMWYRNFSKGGETIRYVI